jgi:hypothetical protein
MQGGHGLGKESEGFGVRFIVNVSRACLNLHIIYSSVEKFFDMPRITVIGGQSGKFSHV